MLLKIFPKLKEKKLVLFLRDFYGCGAYPVLIVALMTCSALFACELAVYYAMISLAIFGLLITDDALCVLPIACCGYMTISPVNSPIHYPETTVFSDGAFLIQFVFIFFVSFLFLAARLVTRAMEGGLRPPRLLGGFLALGAAYMLGGLGTAHASFRSSLFGFVQLVSLAFFYVYFALTVDWERVEKSYLPFLFTAIGVGICIEIADMYTLDNVFLADGSIDRGNLFMGWGIYNNVACVMAMCIPAPCYFAVTRKRGWPYTLLAAFFYFATCFTQSRGGILFGTVVALVCVFYILFSAKGRARQSHLLVLIVLGIAAVGLFVSMRGKFAAIFASLIKIGASPNYRDTIYSDCWDAFLSSPWFGVGFYDTPGVTFDKFAGFMPPRAHDTYFQLLASGGLLSVFAYAVHRVQTLVLFFRWPSREKTFVFFVVLALLLTSIVDCNFFNIGPGILYGILLIYAERSEACPRLRTPLRSLRERRKAL